MSSICIMFTRQKQQKEYLRHMKQTQTPGLYIPFLHIWDARYTWGSTDAGLVQEKIQDTDLNHIPWHTKCPNHFRSYTYLSQNKLPPVKSSLQASLLIAQHVIK